MAVMYFKVVAAADAWRPWNVEVVLPDDSTGHPPGGRAKKLSHYATAKRSALFPFFSYYISKTYPSAIINF
mgnify:CR=1 FL=1